MKLKTITALMISLFVLQSYARTVTLEIPDKVYTAHDIVANPNGTISIFEPQTMMDGKYHYFLSNYHSPAEGAIAVCHFLNMTFDSYVRGNNTTQLSLIDFSENGKFKKIFSADGPMIKVARCKYPAPQIESN